jgi:hypothetical protein
MAKQRMSLVRRSIASRSFEAYIDAQVTIGFSGQKNRKADQLTAGKQDFSTLNRPTLLKGKPVSIPATRIQPLPVTCATSTPVEIDKVSAVIAEIGQKANVVVKKANGKFASAHNLRRAFSARWTERLKPIVLRQLMRHAAVQTTMNYYVNLDASEVANQLWAEWGNTGQERNNLGDIGQETKKASASESDVNAYLKEY